MMAQDDRLRQGVVAILVGGKVTGTGFFVGGDGSVLTCFHVVGDKRSGQLSDAALAIAFEGVAYPAECIFQPSDPQLLDIAVLRPQSRELPRSALLIPLGKWAPDARTQREFLSFGYKLSAQFDGLYALSTIVGRRPVVGRNGASYLQLATELLGAEEIRQGMSGAPVYHESSDQIVGMIVARGEHEAGATPLAAPIEEIGRAWLPLRARLQEDEVARQIANLLNAEIVFSESALRALFEKLTLYGVPRYDELGGDKPRTIIDQLRARGLIYDLVNYIKQTRRDIQLNDLIGPALSTGRNVDFVNRESELRTACGPYAAPYILFDAPAGYGKTELLHAIEQRQLLDGWICFSIETPQGLRDSLDLVHMIARSASLARLLPSLVDLRFAGSFLTAMLRTRLETFGSAGVVILLDNIERIPLDEVDRFLNEFIKDMVSSFHGDQGARPIQLRLVFAGRYVGPQWRRDARALALQVATLTPFSYRFVRETIRRRLPEQTEDLDLLAAHLMQLSGGHPGCIAEALRLVSPGQPAEEQMRTDQARYRAALLPIIDAVRNAIPEPLQPIFDGLSIFRRFSQAILHALIEAKALAYSGDARRLEAELTATYLVKRRDGFIQDEIVRRLLAIRLRWNDGDRFLQLCGLGRQVYERAIATSSRPEFMVLEAIYQELQLAYYASPQDFQTRSRLRERFFGEGGILSSYLALLAAKPDAHDLGANLRALIEDDNGDWEFRFAVNFFLRDDQYDDGPIETMLAQIDRLL